MYDESEQENNGYICIKAQLCEKVNVSGNDSSEKVCIYMLSVMQGSSALTSSFMFCLLIICVTFWFQDNEPVPSGFADLMSSPKSSLSPDKSLQEMDNKSKCMFKTDLCIFY